ncbi:MAG: glycosyltransferase [Planctomycetota bacterium]
MANQPTICHVLHTMNVGGAEVLAAEYGRRSAGEFRVVFACLDELGLLGEQLRADGFVVEVMGRRPGFDWGCGRRLADFFRRSKVDLVHAHQQAPYFYSSLSRLGRATPPVLFMEHGRDYPDYPRPKRKLANRFLLRRGDHVVAVGECVKRALIDNEGIAADRIQVIYNGVDVRRYDPQRPERQQVRREIGVTEEHQVVMQVARLNRLKDQATALRTMQELSRTHPQLRLVLVGDGEERAALEQLQRDLGLENSVIFLGTRRDVPRLLQAADCFLLTSLTEGVALTLIEAMATALPIVATDVGGNSEVVVAEQTGLLVPAQNATATAQAIRRVVDDADWARQLGTRCHQRAWARIDDAAMHAAYRDLYGRLLGIQLPMIQSKAT